MQSGREIVVFDDPHPCAYLPGQTARLPHRYVRGGINPAEFDKYLAAGDRRSGVFVYRTACAACQACQPIRLNLHTFQPGSTQRREQRQGDQVLRVEVLQPSCDATRVALFNQHRLGRNLARDEEPIDEAGYTSFLTDSCCETCELAYYLDDQLVAIAITDVGENSLSAVYTFFDPTVTQVSLGTYSVLRQAQLCRETGRQYLYLGFYVADSVHMNYKAKFHPHERLIDGEWRPFE